MPLTTPNTLYYRPNRNKIIIKFLTMFVRVRYFSGNAMQQYQSVI